MELNDVVRARRMVRSFSERPVDPDLVDRLLDAARRAPSAGNAGGTTWVVLTGQTETARYWDHATTPEWRAEARRFAGLARAPLVLLSLASPAAYLDRYDEPDKAGSGLGRAEGGAEAWPVPYWFGDAAFATMLVLLAATEAGLGAVFLGNFRGEHEVLAALGVPEGWRLFGAVVVGHPDGGDHRSRSLDRSPRADHQSMHRGGW